MRDVLVVLFWAWLLVALGVYGYRIYRRATQGPKATREAREAARDATTATTETSGPGRRGRGVPPLPDGPVEARLPRSLQGQPPPAPDGSASVPTVPPSAGETAGDRPDAVGVVPSSSPPAPSTMLADALQGIRMPADLLPVVEPGETGLVDGRRARFRATGTNVATVAVELGDELRRLGYAVDGLQTLSSRRAGLTATREGTAVAVTVDLDDDTGAVVVGLEV